MLRREGEEEERGRRRGGEKRVQRVAVVERSSWEMREVPWG